MKEPRTLLLVRLSGTPLIFSLAGIGSAFSTLRTNPRSFHPKTHIPAARLRSERTAGHAYHEKFDAIARSRYVAINNILAAEIDEIEAISRP
jgi:hypothetical protein